MLERPASSSIPDSPGVYIFRDVHGRPLYVGKAKSLRKRIANYFGADVAVRTRSMVDASATVDSGAMLDVIRHVKIDKNNTFQLIRQIVMGF